MNFGVWGECSLQRQHSSRSNHSSIPLTLEVPSLTNDLSSMPYLQDVPSSWPHQGVVSPVYSPLMTSSSTTTTSTNAEEESSPRELSQANESNTPDCNSEKRQQNDHCEVSIPEPEGTLNCQSKESSN